MVKKKEEKIFCVYCGTENLLSSKKCSKCSKKLDPKNRPFRDYLREKVEDKLEGDVQDEMLAIMINFIKTHLYGSILTCSIIITAVSVVTNIVNNGNEFKEVSERPTIVNKIEYSGSGLTAFEVANKYVDALNKNDMSIVKSLSLDTLNSNVYSILKGSISYSDIYESTTFLDKNDIFDNRQALSKNLKKYNIVLTDFGVVPNGKYGNYNFFRFAIYYSYCYENTCLSDDSYFLVSNQIELIEIDGNYYVSGSEKMLEQSIDQKIEYEFLLKYEGDTTKYSKQDINDYIDNLN